MQRSESDLDDLVAAVVTDSLTTPASTSQQAALLDCPDPHSFINLAAAYYESSTDAHADATLLYVAIDDHALVKAVRGGCAASQMMQIMARRLVSGLTENDLIARVADDGFAVFIPVAANNCAIAQVEQLRSSLGRRTESESLAGLSLGASIGVFSVSRDESVAKALRWAEIGSRVARSSGGDRIHYCYPGEAATQALFTQMRWVERLQLALVSDDLELMLQPIVSLDEKSHPRHFEVLLRLREHDGTLVSAGEFLPAAEQFGLSSRVDRWVFHSVVAMLASFPTATRYIDTVAINLSAQSLSDERFFEQATATLAANPRLAAKLCFEITETVAITDFDAARSFMVHFKKLGCRFALDDFGTGACTFVYLRQLPVDFIKVDGMFARNVESDALNQAIIRCACEVSKLSRASTVVEYVETDLTARVLRQLGVHYGQGYGLGRPNLAAEVLGELNAEQKVPAAAMAMAH